MTDNEKEEQVMSAGREHDERRKAQAAAARKWKLRSRHEFDWKKAEER